MEIFEDFLKNLSTALSIPSLASDPYGACMLAFDEENLQILFELDSQIVINNVLMSCKVADINATTKIKLAKEILIANGSIDETLSFHPDQDQLFLHRRLYPYTDPDIIRNIVNSFIKRTVEWQSKVKEGEK